MQTFYRKIIVLFVFASIICIAFVAYYFVPFEKIGSKVSLIIEPGTTVYNVANTLESEGVIPSARFFMAWISFRNLGKKMQAGLIVFYKKEGIISAAARLQNASAIELSMTIPEGLTIFQTAVEVRKFIFIDTAVFIALCCDSMLVKEFGLKGKTLEGYLFPETYYFSPKTTELLIIKRMVSTFKEKYSTVKVTATSKNFSMIELITMASIVEREATLKSEQDHISGVFHNRLKQGIPLGADPTVRYALRKFHGQLRVSELKNPSPYNTRLHRGLPPGPICSPGLEAIKASFSPFSTNDLYFVAKWDGSGMHDFSRTNAEHERKKNTIRYKNKLRKKKAIL